MLQPTLYEHKSKIWARKFIFLFILFSIKIKEEAKGLKYLHFIKTEVNRSQFFLDMIVKCSENVIASNKYKCWHDFEKASLKKKIFPFHEF